MVDAGRRGRLLAPNGTSPPIHDMTAAVKIALTTETVLDYLRFFCAFVCGEDGPFMIVETPGQLARATGQDADDKRVLAVADLLRPAKLRGRVDDRFEAEAVVLYGGDLFRADFLVAKGGMVEITEDALLKKELGLKIQQRLV